MRREDLAGRPCGEWRTTGEQLIGQDAEGIDVRAVIGRRVTRRLLRRHVGRRPDREAIAGRRYASAHAIDSGWSASCRRERLGHAEVRDHRVAATHEHVVGLDVSMHDAPVVRVRQRVRDIVQDPQDVVDRKSQLAQQPAAQRLTVDVRHGEVQDAVRLTGGEHRNNVRVLQLRRDLNLATEPLHVHAGQLGVEHLDHYLSVEGAFAGEKHAAHPAAAELALDGERIAEGFLQSLVQLALRCHKARGSRTQTRFLLRRCPVRPSPTSGSDRCPIG